MKREPANGIVAWLAERHDFLQEQLRQQHDPAPDGAQCDFSTVELAATEVKALAKGLEALAQTITDAGSGVKWPLNVLGEIFFEQKDAELQTTAAADLHPELEPIAPRAYWAPGDVVLQCPQCDSRWLQHSRMPADLPAPPFLFWCSECSAKFTLTIECREQKVCLLWQWAK